MMQKVAMMSMLSLDTAVRDVIKAHQAVVDGIATHAEKHKVALESAREKATQSRMIQDGIKRQNGEV